MKNTISKAVLSTVLTVGLIFSNLGLVAAAQTQSEKVQEQVLSVLGVKRIHQSDSDLNYAKGDACYTREAVDQTGQEAQKNKIKEQVLSFLGVSNSAGQENYQLTEISCGQGYSKIKVQKSSDQAQREKVREQVLSVLGVRS